VVGVSAIPNLRITGSGRLMAGLLGEPFPGHTEVDCPHLLIEPRTECDHRSVYSWDAGVWGYGPKGIGIYHSVMGYGHRPHGDAHEQPMLDRALLEQLWAEAGNAVQWRR